MAAFILRLHPTKDHDAVVVLLDQELGKITTYARHFRQSKRRFPHGLELFTSYECSIKTRPSGLASLEEAFAEESFSSITQHIENFAAANVILESLDALIPEGECYPAIMELLHMTFTALQHLEEPTFTALTLLTFETKLQDALHILPNADLCIQCGESLPSLSPYIPGDGFQCAQCISHHTAFPASNLARALKRLRDASLHDVLSKAQTSDRQSLENMIRGMQFLIEDNLRRHAERQNLKARDFYHSLSGEIKA